MTGKSHNYLDLTSDLEKTAKDYCTSSNFDEKYTSIYPSLSKKKIWNLCSQYDKTNYFSLKNTLSTKYGTNNLLLAAGSEDLILRWGKFMMFQNMKVGVVLPTFYRIIDILEGGILSKINSLAPDNLIDLNTVILCNPNPITGKVIDKDELISISKKNPGITFFIDEASMFLLKDRIRYSMIDSVESLENVAVFTSFSKLHGLSGARIGILFSNEKIVKQIETFSPTYPVSSISAYLLEHLLNFDSFFDQIRTEIENNKQEVENFLKTIPEIELSPSVTNCVYFKSINSIDLFKYLLNLGVISLNLDTQEGNTFSGGVRITVHSSYSKHNYLMSKLNQLKIKLSPK